MIIHHIGYVVESIPNWESSLLYKNKTKQIFDPLQQANLALYENSSSPYIELIQPLNNRSYTWNALQKKGSHYHHLCYSISSFDELLKVVSYYKLIQILEPIPALLFDNAQVAFYYNRNKEIIEFLIEPT